MASRFSSLAKRALEVNSVTKDQSRESFLLTPFVNEDQDENENDHSIEWAERDAYLINKENEYHNDLKVPNGNDVKEISSDMASVAWKIHAANKASVKMRNRVKLRMKIKDRMRLLADERLTIKQIFKRYVESSTLHGFLYTCSDTYLVRRFIWTCLMIAGAILFFMKLHDGVLLYYSYPFSTKATMEYVNKLQFPAISFCPMNQFKEKAINNSVLKRLHENHRLPINSNWNDPGYDINGTELVTDLIRASFSVEDFFKECDWISRDTDHPFVAPNYCGLKNFTKYFSDDGSFCFTLNSGDIGHRVLNVDHSGLNHGYELMFDLNTNEALKQQRSSGLKVIIHDQNEPPVLSSGFVLSPGFKTFVKLEKTETYNLPPPFATKCGIKKLKYFKEYNQKACVLEKLTDHVSGICKCRALFMPDNNLPYCSLRQMTTCVPKAKELFNAYEERLGCPIDCQHISYEKRLSESRFLHNPPIGIEPILMKNQLQNKKMNNSHILDLHKALNHSQMQEYVEDNIVTVLFFYADMTKLITKQIPTYTFYNFLGQIGGTFGLVLGASLLTFVEFLDLGCLLIYHQLLRFNKKKKNEEDERKSIESTRKSLILPNNNNVIE